MAAFSGFPARSRQTPVPNAFFSSVLPFISDVTELKVTLFLFNRLSWKRGYPRFVTLNELQADLDLISSLTQEGRDPADELSRGLEKALARGTFLHLSLQRGEETEHLYFLNTEADRKVIARVQRGEVDLGALPKVEPAPLPPDRRTIYRLYEENIGVLSPLIVEELREAEEKYPDAWIADAFREAVRMNRRRWRYIQRILERWESEGRPDGDYQRTPQEVHSRGRAGTGPGGYIVKRRSG